MGAPFAPLAAPAGSSRLVATPGGWYALADDVVYESVDSGLTWAPLPALPQIWVHMGFPQPAEYVDVDVAPDGRLYATGRDAVVRFESGGWKVVLAQPPSMGDASYGSCLSELDFTPSGAAWVTSEPFGLWTWTPDGLPVPAAEGVTRPHPDRSVGGTSLATTADGATWHANEAHLHRRGPADAAFVLVDGTDVDPWGDPAPVEDVEADGDHALVANGYRLARVAPDGTWTDLYVTPQGAPWPVDVELAVDRVYVGLGGTTPAGRALEIDRNGAVTPIPLP